MDDQNRGNPDNQAAREGAYDPVDLNAISMDRIRKSQELMAELDRQLAASRRAQEEADEREQQRRLRNPVRIKRPSR